MTNDQLSNQSDNQQNLNQELIFFNYHEYLISLPNKDYSLIINHFPNIYVNQYSTKYIQTRIIRIPRIYDTIKLSDLIPQFSTYYPGMEPGAITTDLGKSVELELYQNQYYSKVSKLTCLNLSQFELFEIITKINQYLYIAFNPFNFIIFIESILEVLTGGFFIQVLNLLAIYSFTKRELLKLEIYISNLNEKFEKQNRRIKFISPRESNYLSVCLKTILI
ncbi:unnamed protein product [Candida verbasci]|uniref:Ras modification protein ERF4 n=1 Tax=Candida verbasci TaxID=1227364 RepID=A0A9W4TZD4_9ASCO|nr:unnamed protein product [Candida verbasci]